MHREAAQQQVQDGRSRAEQTKGLGRVGTAQPAGAEAAPSRASVCRASRTPPSFLPRLLTLGMQAAFVKYRQMTPRGRASWAAEEARAAAKEAFNEKRPRYPWQRQSLKAARPELHIF